MTAKEYLMQIQQLKTSIQNIDDRVKDLRAQEVSLRSPWPDGIPHGTGKTDPVGAAASKLADELMKEEDRLLRKRRELYRKQIIIMEQIDLLERPEHRRLLYLRYVEGWKWEAIAEDLDKTYQWVASSVRGMHGNALSEFEKTLYEFQKVDRS